MISNLNGDRIAYGEFLMRNQHIGIHGVDNEQVEQITSSGATSIMLTVDDIKLLAVQSNDFGLLRLLRHCIWPPCI